MNNQVEQMVPLQNKLYEKLISKQKQVCGVNNRGGSATQDPDYPKVLRFAAENKEIPNNEYNQDLTM